MNDNQTNNHPQHHASATAKKFGLPQSYTDFDFNIDFDTAFSNIPIDIPASNLLSELLNGPQAASVSALFPPSPSAPPAVPPLLNQRNPNHSQVSNPPPQLASQPVTNSIPALSSPTLASTSLDAAALLALSPASHTHPYSSATIKSETSTAPLFNAQESSMMSQFFEKFNADPEFIFSPKLDSRLLNLTEQDFSTPLSFQTQQHHTKHQLSPNNNHHHPHPTKSWDIPTPDIFPFVGSTNRISDTVTKSNVANTFTNSSNAKLASHTTATVPHDELLARPNPDALRKLPIKYGTDPSFQEGGFQPSYSLSSAIRTRKIPDHSPDSPGFDINNFSNVPIKFENIYNNVNQSNDKARALAAPATTSSSTKNEKKKSVASTSANIVASTRRKSSEVLARPRRENLTEDQKRMNHISSEKRRRDLIKTQFTEMCSLVPKLAEGTHAGVTSNSSKATVLQIVYDYIVFMLEQNKQLRQFLAENNVELTGIIDSTIPSKHKESATHDNKHKEL
jgi:hypothetical protein